MNQSGEERIKIGKYLKLFSLLALALLVYVFFKGFKKHATSKDHALQLNITQQVKKTFSSTIRRLNKKTSDHGLQLNITQQVVATFPSTTRGKNDKTSESHLIITDSMARDVHGIPEAKVVSLSGYTTPELEEYIKGKKDLVKRKKIVIVHVGTNDLSPKQIYFALRKCKIRNCTHSFNITNYMSITDFSQKYQSLLKTIRSINPNAVIILSGIIDRPFDFQFSSKVVKEMNNEIKRLSQMHKNTVFLPTAGEFVKDSHPNMEYFNDRDLLHLSATGTKVFKKWFMKTLNENGKESKRV